MFKKITFHLFFIASLFLTTISTQVLAAEEKADMAGTIDVYEKININQANDVELASVKGIGLKKAQAIVEYREENGDFVSIEDLMKVKGIGKGTLQKIVPFVSL